MAQGRSTNKWTRTSRLSIKISLSKGDTDLAGEAADDRDVVAEGIWGFNKDIKGQNSAILAQNRANVF